MSKKQNKTERNISYLIETYPYAFNSDSFIVQEENIIVNFPGGDYPSDILFPIEKFNNSIEKSKNIEIIDDGLFIANNSVYQIVSCSESDGYLDSFKIDVNVKNSTIKCRYLSRDIVIGIAAIKSKAYNSYITNSIQSYSAIEIIYDNISNRNTEEEISLTDSLLFELSNSMRDIVTKSQFNFITDDDIDDFPEDESEYESEYFNRLKYKKKIKIRPLEKMDEGKRLFLAAMQIHDQDLRFFSFFKVLEYYSPIALRKEVHEALSKKLSSDKVFAPDGDFINSIIKLVNNYSLRRNDRDLIRTVFLECVDIVDLMEYLPIPFKSKIDYDSQKQEKEKLLKQLADIVVNTRNKVVHAKSNYKLTGEECPEENMKQFTIFIEKAALGVIRWFEKLPTHLKINKFE